ncbi:1031_t:CDS:2 [Dentiscutata erythropus]|uniref:1031_t:CDS:1 n=1 Tax=Dentiscutata erythropus TaxID=1348616 RepID=A0A9N8W6E9_9GLOM|nr:1031_t:CDS:2 [Dentiscutata erythropus]
MKFIQSILLLHPSIAERGAENYNQSSYWPISNSEKQDELDSVKLVVALDSDDVDEIMTC